MTTTADYDWNSELSDESKTEVRETNVMPRTGTSRTPTGTRRTGSRLQKRLETLRSNLTGQMFQAGTMIGLGLPVTGYYIAQESDNFTSAIVQLAQRRTEWLDALEKVADIAPGITIGRTVLGIGASLGVDRYHRTHGESGFNPDKQACAFLGVTAAYYAVYKESADATASGVFAPPPVSEYVPVR